MTSKRLGEALEPVNAAARIGCAIFPKLDVPACSAKPRSARLQRLRPSNRRVASVSHRRATAGPGASPSSSLRRLGVTARGGRRRRKRRIGQFDQGLGRGPSARPCRRSGGPRRVVGAPASSSSWARIGRQVESLGVGLAQIVPFRLSSLSKSMRARRPADAVQVEPFDRLVGRDDFVVAVAPAEAQQVVAHGRGQIAHVAIGLDAERAVALGQLLAVRAVDQRDVCENRAPPNRARDTGDAGGRRWSGGRRRG